MIELKGKEIKIAVINMIHMFTKNTIVNILHTFAKGEKSMIMRKRKLADIKKKTQIEILEKKNTLSVMKSTE